jgi:pimeloyl-ACP methyl ester carboxylesterase
MRETSFDARGSMVRWIDSPGHEPARVFVHGLGGTGAATFGDVASDPRLAGNRTLVLDLPGHGHSDRPDDWSYDLDAHAAALARVCDAGGVTAVDLVGHSLGGDIAIVAAARYPGLAGRLVVCEANLDPLPATMDGARFSQRIVAQGEAGFRATGYDELLATVPFWRPTLRLASPLAVFRSAERLIAGTQPTMRELFRGLEVPRTFIRGDRGEPLLDAEGLGAAGVRLAVIAAAGHVMMADAPELFVATLLAALEVRVG